MLLRYKTRSTLARIGHPWMRAQIDRGRWDAYVAWWRSGVDLPGLAKAPTFAAPR